MRDDQVSLHGWAVGEGPALLPLNVGIPFGPSFNNNSSNDDNDDNERGYVNFKLSMHYDNRDHVSGGVDDSGIRIYYTSKPRDHMLSLLLLGDPLIALMDQPVVPNNSTLGLSRHSFECPSSCTHETVASMTELEEDILSQNSTSTTPLRGSTTTTLHKQQSYYQVTHNITVVTELLHMHETGARMVNRVRRNGTIVHEGVIDYWDNRMSGLYPVPSSAFAIQAGDTLETECYYNTSKSSSSVSLTTDERGSKPLVKFGTGSQDEMCIAFLYYYPKLPKPLTLCGLKKPTERTYSSSSSSCQAVHTMADIMPEDHFGRRFGGKSSDIGMEDFTIELGSGDLESRAPATSFGLFSLLILAALSLTWFPF